MVSVVEDHSLQSLSLLHHVQFGSFFAPSASIIADVDGAARRSQGRCNHPDRESSAKEREEKTSSALSLSLLFSHSLSRGLLGVQRTKERQNTMTWCSLEEEEASERLSGEG